MNDQSQSMKGHAFCNVTRCKHCVTNRCDHLKLKDVEFTVKSQADCGDYEATPPKHFCIDLNEDEISDLLTLLEPSSDEGDPGEQLYLKLWKLRHQNPIVNNMYFINVYDREQQYGGPEEGGWWYHSMICEGSYGYDCVDWNQISIPDFRFLIDMFIEQLQTEFEGDEVFNFLNNDNLKTEITEALLRNDYFEYAELDHYGVGRVVAIERQPGAQHNLNRQHYC